MLRSLRLPEREDQKKMGMSMHWYAYPREDSGTFPTVEELPWAMQCTKESAARFAVELGVGNRSGG